MQVDKTFGVGAPADRALAYIADFRTLTEWEPTVRSVSQTAGDGPGVGAAYRIEMRFLGRSQQVVYECVEFEDDYAVLEGHGKGFAALDRIEVATMGLGTQVNYFSDIRLQGVLGRILEPVISLIFEYNSRQAVRRLQEVLD